MNTAAVLYRSTVLLIYEVDKTSFFDPALK